MHLEVKELLNRHLPAHEVTYLDEEVQEILGLKFRNAGVAVKLHDGLEVFGSSSSQEESPLMYAAFECLERYVLLAQKNPVQTNENFRLALSNGVAIHSCQKLARESALLELVERNEVLRSWYYNTPLKHLDNSLLDFGKNTELLQEYDLVIAEFSNLPGFSVIGVFAFPKKKANLVYGFGCGRDLDSALAKARKEFISRLGFLWGEEPSADETPKASPLYHQEYYLRPENHFHLKEWLFEDNQMKTHHLKLDLSTVEYVDFTPSHWQNSFAVIKAVSPFALPLFFGKAPRDLFPFTHRCDIPHPVA